MKRVTEEHVAGALEQMRWQLEEAGGEDMCDGYETCVSEYAEAMGVNAEELYTRAMRRWHTVKPVRR